MYLCGYPVPGNSWRGRPTRSSPMSPTRPAELPTRRTRGAGRGSRASDPSDSRSWPGKERGNNPLSKTPRAPRACIASLSLAPSAVAHRLANAREHLFLGAAPRAAVSYRASVSSICFGAQPRGRLSLTQKERTSGQEERPSPMHAKTQKPAQLTQTPLPGPGV